MKGKILLIGLLVLAIAISGCIEPQPTACTLEAEVCPDGTTVGRNPALNCEFDPCPTVECKGEGESIPIIANPPKCCPGLTLIPPKEADWVGISGYCTAKCGNGTCDTATESNYNCPEDCSLVDSDTGVASGTVLYGRGDCMPCACDGEDCSNCPQGAFSAFNGDLFFIEKDELDSLGDGNFSALLEGSQKTVVVNGIYEINLRPGAYVAMPRYVYQYGDNIITISAGQITNKNLQFFECTSY